ncbi:uncharacterized protein N7529_009378 [Penicillium soppii]|uniref:uncharacterized protein n=1 Tax=Penicillium soppii TaxID=69789 RepID=UPI0025491913|nr:uncharacterized protein N7529_009378 [Penicillium soppii]KAJ5855434.1 hypothetical protein N7529_009378 [Penicillium soppii]
MPTPQSHDVALLPSDIFWMIMTYLEPSEIVRCRRVSRAWNEAFSNPSILLPLLKRHFPWTKEVKSINTESNNQHQSNGLSLFDKVASRYMYLERGKPRSIQKYRLCNNFGRTEKREWYEVQPWESHSASSRALVERPFPEARWTVENNLIVFPSAEHEVLVLMDLETDRKFMVPFIICGNIIRRIRLEKRLLVIEWADPKAFHWLNDSDGVHRHFASSFDVTKGVNDSWSITPRNEWKIMFLGHPLSERDRFFSAHSNTHYVIYIWQPNRSLYTADEDAPIESLFVWDISKTSSYRPSLDPAGRNAPDDAPCIVSRFGFQDLEFFGVRQRGYPNFQRLEITKNSQAIEITENFGSRPEGGLPHAITTSIPLTGYGPHWRRDRQRALPPYWGNSSLHSEFMSPDDFSEDFWSRAISQVTDGDHLRFVLHFQQMLRMGKRVTDLIIWIPWSKVTIENVDFTGQGKLAGCEKYLLGENKSRELVIYRFDR